MRNTGEFNPLTASCNINAPVPLLSPELVGPVPPQPAAIKQINPRDNLRTGVLGGIAIATRC